jgi:hypothetical protein
MVLVVELERGSFVVKKLPVPQSRCERIVQTAAGGGDNTTNNSTTLYAVFLLH